MINALILAGGLALLVKAADQFVAGAARIGLALHMSAVTVGAVIIGFGTSAPELLITALAAAGGSADIAAGNLVGSNVANLGVVAALCALVVPLGISSGTLRREAPLATGAVILFAVLLQGGLTRVEGMLLLVVLVAATTWIVRATPDEEDCLGPETSDAAGAPGGMRREVVRTVAGLLGTLAGAQLVVMAAKEIAADAGISEGFVGLTLVALGTSLPELVTGIQAARRGHSDFVVGNVLGSNMFNSLAGGGLLALIAPGRFGDPDIAGVASLGMVALAVVAFFLFATGRKLVRWEAIVLLACCAALLPFLSR